MEDRYFTYMKKIRDLREDSDYSQEYVADFLGTSQTMYSRYERGASEIPLRHLVNLCKLYQVSSDYILGLSQDKGTQPDKTPNHGPTSHKKR